MTTYDFQPQSPRSPLLPVSLTALAFTAALLYGVATNRVYINAQPFTTAAAADPLAPVPAAGYRMVAIEGAAR